MNLKTKEKENMWNTSITLPPEIVQQIDNQKGDISRTLWMRRAIIKALGDADTK